MKTLHLIGIEGHGGAAEASRLIMSKCEIPWEYSCKPNKLQSAIRTVWGFCDPLLVKQLRVRIRAINPVFVHLHRWSDFGTAAIKAALLEDKPIIWHVLDYWFACPRHNLYPYPCESKCLRCYDKAPWPLRLPMIGRRNRILKWVNQVNEIHCLSHHSKEVLRSFGVTTNIYVDPLRVSVPKIDLPTIPKRVLFCGWKAPNKGWLIVQELMKRLPDLDWKILGMDKDGSGVITHDQVLKEIAQAQVVLVPELWPNPGSVLIGEVLAMGTNSPMFLNPGKPTLITSHIGGIPEQVKGRGILCTYNDVDAFERAICSATK